MQFSMNWYVFSQGTSIMFVWLEMTIKVFTDGEVQILKIFLNLKKIIRVRRSLSLKKTTGRLKIF